MEASMTTIVGRRAVFFDRMTFSWTAVLAGVIAALVVQVLLTMLGLGIGLISLDTPTAADSPLGVSWAAFLYWAVAGIIAAFAGGWVAGAVAAPGTGAGHGLAAWALATLIVVGASALAAGATGTIASNLAGPTSASIARLNDLTANDTRPARTTGQRSAQQEVETARKAVAAGMLASFVALLIGAAAAFMGGMVGNRNAFVTEP
jgi:hypothetical protein